MTNLAIRWERAARLRNDPCVTGWQIASARTFPPKQFPRTPTRPETIL